MSAEYFEQLVVLFIFLIILLAILGGFSPGKPAQKPGPEVTPDEAPDSGGDGVIFRNFYWTSQSVQQSLDLSLQVQLLQETVEAAKAGLMDGEPSKTCMRSTDEYFMIARQQINDESFGWQGSALTQVRNYIRGRADQEFLSDPELTLVALNFVQNQCIPYSYDHESTGHPEYFRYPVETIHDQTGDCDCKAILACALFKALGFRSKFAIMPGHAALVVNLTGSPMAYANYHMDGEAWFYCETTGDGWRPGVFPDGIDPDSVEFSDV